MVGVLGDIGTARQDGPLSVPVSGALYDCRHRRASRVDRVSECGERAACAPLLDGSQATKCSLDPRFDGSTTRAVDPASFRGQPEHGTPAIGGVGLTRDEPLILETAKHARQRARVQMQRRRDRAGGDAGTQSHHAQHQPLRAGHAASYGHLLGDPFHAMHDPPQHLHETEHFRQPDFVNSFSGRPSWVWHQGHGRPAAESTGCRDCNHVCRKDTREAPHAPETGSRGERPLRLADILGLTSNEYASLWMIASL